MIAKALLIMIGIHLVLGAAFALPFVLVGAGKIDPHAAHGSWGFRLLIIPGTVFLWPLLALRWTRGIHEPPEENSPHRRAARIFCRNEHEKAHEKCPSACQASRPPEDGRLVSTAATGKGEGAAE
jgi:hypothetical protein